MHNGRKSRWNRHDADAYVTAHPLNSERQENWLQRLNGEAITLVMAVGGFVVLLIGIAVILVLMLLKQEEHEPTSS